MATVLNHVPVPPRRPGPYKVDISRGSCIGRVSSEWFSRPDDERYLSLRELHAATLARARRATTRTVETREVRVEATRGSNSKARPRSCSRRSTDPRVSPGGAVLLLEVEGCAVPMAG